jgi:hypothetical protein
MKKILFTLLLANVLILSAQDQPSYKLYGFIRTDYTLDSRKILSSNQDLFSLYPMYTDKNTVGEDLNATPSTSMTNITSRFGFNFSIPTDFLGAKKASGKIETDFSGSPGFTNLRLRQAFTQLNWEHSSLLVGQTWHPMFTTGVQPLVISLNGGALFQPFNRSPQIRYDYLIKSIRLSAAAIYEMQYTSYGPDASSLTTNTSAYTYQRNALLPECYVSIESKSSNWLVGLGGSYKSILPMRYQTDNLNVKHLNNNLLSTPAVMLYGSYSTGKFVASAKTILGQNLTNLNFLGGYAITPDFKYIPYNAVSSFIHLNYGVKHQFGLLGGYTKNLGPAENLPLGSTIYGLGIDKANTASERIIGDVYRITPTYSYNYKNWKLGVEYEYTNANWGTRSITTGAVVPTERISNSRIYAILQYTF